MRTSAVAEVFACAPRTETFCVQVQTSAVAEVFTIAPLTETFCVQMRTSVVEEVCRRCKDLQDRAAEGARPAAYLNLRKSLFIHHLCSICLEIGMTVPQAQEAPQRASICVSISFSNPTLPIKRALRTAAGDPAASPGH